MAKDIPEIVSIVISIVALSVSIWNHYEPSAVREAELRKGSLLSDGVLSSESSEKRFTETRSVSLENVGKLPASNVLIMLRGDNLPHDLTFAFDPPLPHRTEHVGNTYSLLVIPELAGGAHVKVTFALEKPVAQSHWSDTSAWVMSDGTQPAAVPWRYGGGKASKQLTLTVLPAPQSKSHSKHEGGKKPN